MIGDEAERELAVLMVARVGRLEETGSPWEPYRLVDPSGDVVAPVGVFLRELQASGRSATTQRSYGMDLLRWFRFLWAIEVPWDEATRVEAVQWMRSFRVLVGKSAARDVVEGGYAEGDRGCPAGHLVELNEFGFRACKADMESFDFAVPYFALGLGDPVE